MHVAYVGPGSAVCISWIESRKLVTAMGGVWRGAENGYQVTRADLLWSGVGRFPDNCIVRTRTLMRLRALWRRSIFWWWLYLSILHPFCPELPMLAFVQNPVQTLGYAGYWERATCALCFPAAVNRLKSTHSPNACSSASHRQKSDGCIPQEY